RLPLTPSLSQGFLACRRSCTEIPQAGGIWTMDGLSLQSGGARLAMTWAATPLSRFQPRRWERLRRAAGLRGVDAREPHLPGLFGAHDALDLGEVRPRFLRAALAREDRGEVHVGEDRVWIDAQRLGEPLGGLVVSLQEHREEARVDEGPLVRGPE